MGNLRRDVWGFAALRRDVGFCDGMCGFAMGCGTLRRDVWFFGLKRRNCDLNHENLRMDLVQKKKFRLEP